MNRLATAQTSAGSPTWGQSYSYDGWGNLTDQNVILGSAPTMHVAYNPGTNRQTGDVADANGNIGSSYTYDMSNRLIQASGTSMVYAYAPGNKRVWRGDGSSTNEYTFWSPGGQKLATYTPTMWGLNLTGANIYFGSRLIAKGITAYGSGAIGDSSGYVWMTSVATDRLGSIGKFYPYGQERPSATANDKEKFTGYYRDAATGLDYAVNRYHQPGVGRFMTADPAASSAKINDPGSWNRYAYVGGDPVNYRDRTGKYRWDTDDGAGDEDDDGDGFGGGAISMLVQIADGNRNVRQDCADQGLVFSFAGGLGGVGSCGGPVGGPPETAAPPPQVTCSITAYARGVPFGGSPASHTYIQIIDPATGVDDILEGGPTNRPKFGNPLSKSWGGLQGVISGTVDPTQRNPLPGDNPSTNQVVGSDVGASSVCDAAMSLLNDVEAYDNGYLSPYAALPNGVTTFNSNSFTYTLLNQVGLAGPNGPFQEPGWSPGWGQLVPGL